MELSFHFFYFSMKIVENAFVLYDGVFIFHFRKLENMFWKFWKTTQISFIIYIEVQKTENFHFLGKLLKTYENSMNQTCFLSFHFPWKIFHNQTHRKLLVSTCPYFIILLKVLVHLGHLGRVGISKSVVKDFGPC